MRLAESYSKALIIKSFERLGKPYATIREKCDRCGGSGVFYVAVHNGHGVPAQPDGGVCYKCRGEGSIVQDVRMYTDAEFERMERAKKAAADKKQREWDAQAEKRKAERNLDTMHRYGFQDTEAFVVLGNTFEIKDQLKEAGARFSPELHWVCPAEPTWLTDHGYVKVSVADVLTMNEAGYFVLRDDAAEFINAFEPVRGNHLGIVGHKLSATVTLVRSVPYDASFGYHHTTGYIYIFETSCKDTLVWKTTSVYLAVDKMYQLEGTVKEHSEYNKVKQTVLTRCKIKGELL